MSNPSIEFMRQAAAKHIVVLTYPATRENNPLPARLVETPTSIVDPVDSSSFDTPRSPAPHPMRQR